MGFGSLSLERGKVTEPEADKTDHETRDKNRGMTVGYL